jgi:hypothetical protein
VFSIDASWEGESFDILTVQFVKGRRYDEDEVFKACSAGTVEDWRVSGERFRSGGRDCETDVEVWRRFAGVATIRSGDGDREVVGATVEARWTKASTGTGFKMLYGKGGRMVQPRRVRPVLPNGKVVKSNIPGGYRP